MKEEVPKEEKSLYQQINERHLENLRVLSDVLELSVLREELFNGTQSIVVDDGRGKEVHIGFPDGMHNPDGTRAYPPVATGTIFEPKIKMGMYGHGAWRRSIDI